MTLAMAKLSMSNEISGIGEYFWDSLFADIESLVIYAGVHVREHGLCRMLSKRFTTKL